MRFGCKTCRKEVMPINGRLICCGHNETLPKTYVRVNGQDPEEIGKAIGRRLDSTILGTNGLDCDPQEPDYNWDFDRNTDW
jgi:hypothetical protein